MICLAKNACQLNLIFPTAFQSWGLDPTRDAPAYKSKGNKKQIDYFI